MSASGMSVEQVNDFSQIEDCIVDLLRAAVGGMSPKVHVLTAVDLDGVKENAQLTPALHVISGGFRPVESAYGAARLAHTWYVVAAVRNVAAQRSGAAARREAGPLLARAIGALLSERLPGSDRPMELAAGPRGEYRAGFYYLPSTWTVETIFRKPKKD